MNVFKACRTAAQPVALAALAICGAASIASAQNLTIPAETDVRAFEVPADVTPGQLAAQGRYARPAIGYVVPGFGALAPGYQDDQR